MRIPIIRGDDPNIAVTARYRSTGEAIDLTGASIKVQLFDPDTGLMVESYTNGSGIIVINAPAGKFWIQPPHADTKTFLKTLLMEVEATLSGGRVVTLRDSDLSPVVIDTINDLIITA